MQRGAPPTGPDVVYSLSLEEGAGVLELEVGADFDAVVTLASDCEGEILGCATPDEPANFRNVRAGVWFLIVDAALDGELGDCEDGLESLCAEGDLPDSELGPGTYHIFVDGLRGEADRGSFTLQVDWTAPPDGDCGERGGAGAPRLLRR